MEEREVCLEARETSDTGVPHNERSNQVRHVGAHKQRPIGSRAERRASRSKATVSQEGREIPSHFPLILFAAHCTESTMC